MIQLCSFLLFLNKKTKLVWQNIEHMIWGFFPINNGIVIFNIKGPTKYIFSIFLFTHTNLISSFLHLYWWYWIVFANFYFAPSFLLEVSFSIETWLGKTPKDLFSNIVSFSVALESSLCRQQFSQRCRLDWKSQNKKVFCKNIFELCS